MVTAQEQALGTEGFRQNQVLFRCFTTTNEAIKKQIITSVEQIFFLPIKDQVTCFGQLTALEMMDHIFRAYRLIDEINVKENALKMMRPYNL